MAENLDSFRILRANTQFLGGHRPISILAITSPLPEEGKSTVAAWYAYANALAGKRTVLVECDLHRPVLANRFELVLSPGLNEHLIGGAEASAIRRTLTVEGPTAQSLTIGLASAFNATLDSVATNLWFRYIASLVPVIEGDDGTTDTDDQATGVTSVGARCVPRHHGNTLIQRSRHAA